MQWRRELSWNPSDLQWRIAVLFMVGSFLFALGSFPPYSQLMDARVVGITFVVGSIFFTTAGYSQLVQIVNDPLKGDGRRLRLWAWQPHKLLWWAALIQFIGTLFFNVNTIRALADTLTTVEEANRLVWAPDFLGCIAFLVASHFFWLAVCHRLWRVISDDPDWWGSLLNYVGSIFFMLSALGSFTLDTGQELNITIVNLGTFVGAVCFYVGAYLLLPPYGVAARSRSDV
ncbi:MAG TPA: hypothetical protein VES40_16225 [Ilumatobacteraceae bacterium]|nr:hypothetical protein [Ilumatobacteraceae bacterium]